MGECGELVGTLLTKEAMSVIRYRTRDLTWMLLSTARSMHRTEKVHRRQRRPGRPRTPIEEAKRIGDNRPRD